MSRSRRRLYSALAALTTITAVVVSAPVTASAATPDRMAFTSGPASATADGTVAVQVEVQDSNGDPVVGNSDTIELTLNTGTINSGGSVDAADGTANFTLEIHTAGTYTLTAHDADTTLPNVNSGSFTVSPGLATKLRFEGQPTDTFTHEAIQTSSSGPVTVRVEDQYNNLETGDTSTAVSIGLSTGSFTSPGSVTTATASGGIASFGSLFPEPDAEGTGRTLSATSGSLTADTSAPFAVVPSADLSIVKTGPIEEFAGNTVGYTLSIHNAGPSTAAAPSVTEMFPSDVTNPRYCVAGVCSSETDFTAYTAPITLSNLASGGDVTIKVRADIPSSESKDTVLHNSASISSTTHDPNGSNNTSGPIDTTVETAADLGVTVTPDPDGSAGHDVIAGDTSNEVFHVDVLNGGPSDGGTYTLTLNVSRLGDAGGTGLVSAPTGCSADNANDKIVCSRTGIAAHTHDLFDITVSISSGYVNPPNGSTLTYNGTISAQAVTDPAGPNDSTGNQNLTVIARADLGIGVTFEQEPPGYIGHDAVAGTNEIFHMKVTNYGYSDNRGFTVTLTVPDYDGTKLTLQSAPGCSGNASTHKVTCTYAGPPFFSPGDKTFDITFHISASYTDPGTTKLLHYSAALSSLTPTDEGTANGGEGAHPDSTGDQTLNVDSVADISNSDVSTTQTATEEAADGFTGSAGFNPSAPGNRNTVRYEVTVSNHGPSDAYGVALTESLPSTHLQTGSIKYCIVTNTIPCTDASQYSPYTNTTQQVLLGTIALNSSKVVRFRVPLIGSDRRGSAVSFMAGTATATAATDSSDPTPANNSGTVDINLYTVPDAPTIQTVQPGNQQIAVSWTDGANGGNAVTGYDIFANGTSYFVPIANTTLSSGTRSAIFPASYTTPTTILTNGTNYTVKVEARNAAGDSDPSSTLQTAPCATCVIRLVSGATTLNTFSTQIASGPCFPGPRTGSGAESLPGATTSDPVVSCFQLTAAQAAAKVGALTALRETAVGPDGSCPTGSTCVGPTNQRVSLLVPPGSGTSTQIIQTVLYDKTVAASVYGDVCNKLPCATKSTIYDVFLTTPSGRQFIGSSLMNGDPATGRPAWCTLTNPNAAFNPDPGTGQNLYQIPSGKTACVVDYVHINTSEKASRINGNTPNGKEGNADFRLDIVFLGDGGLTTCRTCR